MRSWASERAPWVRSSPSSSTGSRDLFRAMPVRPFLKPAIGGLVMGAIALVFPQVIGGGYGWMQRAIDGQLALELLAALAVVKIVALSFTVASGGSGGVFAPSLFSGAMLGGALAAMTHLPAAPFVIVGMAAVFAGAAHVPIATMMMVIEMTGSYTLLVPAALAVVISYLVQTRLSAHARYRSIYEAQVTSRADSPAHHKQHLDIALRLLRGSDRASAEHMGELDLIALLQAGIPVELGDDRRLAFGILRADSPLAHTTVAASGDKLEWRWVDHSCDHPRWPDADPAPGHHARGRRQARSRRHQCRRAPYGPRSRRLLVASVAHIGWRRCPARTTNGRPGSPASHSDTQRPVGVINKLY